MPISNDWDTGEYILKQIQSDSVNFSQFQHVLKCTEGIGSENPVLVFQEPSLGYIAVNMMVSKVPRALSNARHCISRENVRKSDRFSAIQSDRTFRCASGTPIPRLEAQAF